MLYEKIELEESEAVLKVVRKHWFIIFTELFGVVILLLTPLLSLGLAALFPTFINFVISNISILAFATTLWLLFSVMSGFMIWTHFYLDLWVITDRRIIVIEQIHFFNRKVSSFRLERLQDIKVTIDGIIPTFLNFGTIRAQTASAAESAFKTTGLPDPRGLQSIIQKATDERLKSIGGQISHLVE